MEGITLAVTVISSPSSVVKWNLTNGVKHTVVVPPTVLMGVDASPICCVFSGFCKAAVINDKVEHRSKIALYLVPSTVMGNIGSKLLFAVVVSTGHPSEGCGCVLWPLPGWFTPGGVRFPMHSVRFFLSRQQTGFFLLRFCCWFHCCSEVVFRFRSVFMCGPCYLVYFG